MKNCIRPHYEKLKPLKSGFIENWIFENNRDPWNIDCGFTYISGNLCCLELIAGGGDGYPQEEMTHVVSNRRDWIQTAHNSNSVKADYLMDAEKYNGSKNQFHKNHVNNICFGDILNCNILHVLSKDI